MTKKGFLKGKSKIRIRRKCL